MSQIERGWDAIAQLDFDAALAIASRLLNNPHLDIRHQAYRMMGMANYRKRSVQQAIPYFEHAVQLVDNYKDRFSLCMCYALLGDMDRADRLFQNIDSLWGLPVECYVSIVMCYTEPKHFQRAVDLLEKIKLSYTLLGITDQTFLAIRGQLAFHYALDAVHYVLNMVSASFDTAKWIKSFAEEMDEEGKKSLALVSDQVCHTKGPFTINQPNSRLQYPLLCKIEDVSLFEEERILGIRVLYGKLHVGDLVAIYSMSDKAVIGQARAIAIQKRGVSVQQAQAKEVAGITLDKWDGSLNSNDWDCLTHADC
ncbi:MAG: hypothetical protein H7A40_00880 [Chlamydiales bacterium]|nr:hypothetical protein [Chlamydiales bacterium]